MRAFIVVAAAAGLAAAVPHQGYESVVYSTEVQTVISCGPEVTNCPGNSGHSSTVAVPPPTSVTSVGAEQTPSVSHPASVPAVSKSQYAPESSAAETPSVPASVPAVSKSSTGPKSSTSVDAGETPVPSKTGPSESSETPCESSTLTVTVPATKSTPYGTGNISQGPHGTGSVPYPSGSTPIWGTASSSGVGPKQSSYESLFTGAAGPQATMGAIAGVAGFAALFL